MGTQQKYMFYLKLSVGKKFQDIFETEERGERGRILMVTNRPALKLLMVLTKSEKKSRTETFNGFNRFKRSPGPKLSDRY